MKVKNKAIEERVYKTAEDLIIRHGIRGWSMDSLAEASGITKRTLYKIITSKEELIHDIAYRMITDIQKQILELSKPDRDFMESLEEIIDTTAELLKNNLINNYSQILYEYPALEPEIIRENEKLFNGIRNFFQSGIDKGYLRNDITPLFIHQMFQAFVIYFMKYSSFETESTNNIRQALHYLFEGIKKQDG